MLYQKRPVNFLEKDVKGYRQQLGDEKKGITSKIGACLREIVNRLSELTLGKMEAAQKLP